jgi:hypothetical protein
VANTAVSWAKVAVIDSVEVGGLHCIAVITVVPEHCPVVHPPLLARVPCTQFQLSRERVWCADRI